MKKSRKKLQKLFIISIIFLFLIISGIFLAHQRYSSGKILSGIYLDEIDLSKKSFEEVNEIINKKNLEFQEHVFTIIAGEKKYNVFAKYAGLTLNSDQALNEIKATGREKNLFVRSRSLFKLSVREIRISSKLEFNPKIYEEFRVNLGKILEEPAKDASISLDGENIVIGKESSGYSIDTENLQSALVNNISSFADEPIYLQTAEVKPTVTTTDVQPTIDQTTGMINKKIVLNYSGKNFEVSKSTLASWIQFKKIDNIQTPEFNQELIKNYINDFSQKNDQSVQDHRINPVTKQVYSTGRVGRKMDVDDTFNQIVSNLDKNQISINIKISTVNYQTKCLQTGKHAYVAIDPIYAAFSRLYTLNDCAIINRYYVGVSTRDVRPYYPTPTGEYKIENKSELSISTIWNGFKMPYWQRFFSGFGFHGPPEGYENSYLSNYGPPSGGCVVFERLQNAKDFYDWTTIGTPVIIEKASIPSCHAVNVYNYTRGDTPDEETLAKYYRGPCVD